MAYNDVIMADAPAAYWRGPITAGQVVDDAAGFDLTVVGAVTNTASIVPSVVDANGALSFPGTDADYLTRNGNFINVTTSGLTNPVSIEFWCEIPPSANPSGCVFVSAGPFASGQAIYTGDLRRVSFNGSSTDVLPGVYVLTGRLLHVVVTAGNSVVTCYVNAGQTANVDASTVSGALAFWSANTTSQVRQGIGALFGVGGVHVPGYALEGKLQEVAIYSSVLSAEQVHRHYFAGLDTGEAPRVESAKYIGGGQLLVSFTKAVYGTTVGNFSIASASVDSVASISNDHRQVLLNVSGMTAGSPYTLTVAVGVVDALGVGLGVNNTATFEAEDSTLSLPATSSIEDYPSHAGTVSFAGETVLSPSLTPVWHMRAWHSLSGEYVYWSSVGGSDYEARGAGVPAVELTNIVVIGTDVP